MWVQASSWLFAEIWQLVFHSVTSKQFWDQVAEENIVMMEAAFAYKHDFQLFGYSAKDYLSKIGKHIGSWISVKIMKIEHLHLHLQHTINLQNLHIS